MQCFNSKRSFVKKPSYKINGCEEKGLIEKGSYYLNHKLFKK